MENSDSSGEHSRKNKSDCDAGDGGERDDGRPFKKARYVWQLKGKYHLKASANNNNNNGAKPVDCDEPRVAAEDATANSSDSDSDADCANGNNNNEIANNNLCHCIDDLLSHSNAILERSDSDEEMANNIDKAISDDIPITLVKFNGNRNSDVFLQKWQARQVAKSFVDNTINSILEHWKIAPFDAADLVENCETGEQVEDEGIMMAIQSHGLHSSGLRYVAPSADDADVGGTSRYQASAANFEEPPLEVEDSLEMDDPMDFLNAAVSVAIQKKGLSSYNYG